MKPTESEIEMAVKLWGKDIQIIVCMEELAELIQALAKEMRGSLRDDPGRHLTDLSNIAEEMADVEICLSQIRYIFDTEVGSPRFSDLVSCNKKRKLERLRDRINISLQSSGKRS